VPSKFYCHAAQNGKQSAQGYSMDYGSSGSYINRNKDWDVNKYFNECKIQNNYENNNK